MSLSLVQEAVTTTTPVYDSGWVDVRGDSTAQTLESQTFDKDVVLYVFGTKYINTQCSFWKVRIEDDYGVTTIANWRNVEALGNGIPNSFTDGALHICACSTSDTVSQARANSSSNGFQIKAGENVQFVSDSGANTGHGISYRFIAVEESVDDLIARVK